MLFAELIELVMVVVIVLVLATQIVTPLLRGTPFFPLLRRGRKLERELARATEDVRAAEIEDDIAATRRQAESIRRSTNRSEYL